MVASLMATPVHGAQCSTRSHVAQRASSGVRAISLSSAPRRAFAAAQRSAEPRKSLQLTRAAEAETVEAETPETIGSGWAAEELRALEQNVERADAPVYALNFLWLDKNIAVAADQVFGSTSPAGGQRAPMTEYFFWPKKDAWEELKAALETRPWISERDRVLLLNKTTEVINYWQDDTKHSVEEAREKFPDCKFLGS